MRSKKELAIALEHLEEFTKPDVQLEQYVTPADIAAQVLWRAHLAGDILDKHILDLGAGTGILGLGALLLGAQKVTFIEQDVNAVRILEKNLAQLNEKYELGDTKIVLAQVNYTDISADVIITNPPFGTRNKGIDKRFLDYALTHAKIIYSFHKTSTLSHLRNHIRILDARIVEEISFSFELKETMEHHTKRIERIEVTCLKIVS